MRAGDVIAERFVLASVAGKGGMGVVWRAHDRATGTDVAIKVMNAGVTDGARFAREVQVLRALNDPGIVRHVADGETDHGVPWLALEWLDGEDLLDRLQRGALGVTECQQLGLRLSRALAALHAAGGVHRDLKPANVRLCDGRCDAAKLLDFGIVRPLQARPEESHTLSGSLVGTPGFMSPEQARGDESLDARSDLFSLGALLYHCLAGRPPFQGSTLVATLARVILEDPPPLRTLRPECPSALEGLVRRLLAKDRDRRPTSAADVARALSDLSDTTGASVPISATSLAQREQRWVCVFLAEKYGAELELELPTVVDGKTWVDTSTPLLFELMSDGARVEVLRDGALLLLWSGNSGAADLARRAARAALRLESRLGTVSRALSAGRVTVGEAFPLGAAVDRAAALLPESRGALVVDVELARLLEDGFDVVDDAGRCVLVREREVRRSRRTLLGRATPCVGRDVELSTLTAVLSEVIDDGAAAAVLVTGETGIGKSRVRYEWVEHARAAHDGLRVWQSQGDVMYAGAAFGVAAELVRDACGARFAASPDDVRERIARVVSERVEVEDRARVASRLCEMCGAPWETGIDEALETARGDAIVMGDQVRAAWEDFLVASCAAGPVLLVVENLQWADPSSLALVDRALRNFGRHPFMVLGVGRPEHRDAHAKLWSERGVREVVVGPLKDKPAERLVRAVLGADVAEARVRELVERAAGNPYFLEELVRAEADGRGDDTPDTVLALVEARMLRLDAESRRALRAASVYGARFDARGVAAVLGVSSVTPALEQLAGEEWLAAVGDGAFAFRQSTSRDAAYAMLVDDDKRLAHGRAADWLAASAEPDAAAIAEHYVRAGTPERAAAWWVKATQRALEANDFAACVARAEAAERCGAEGEALCDARLARAEAHFWRGEARELLATVERAVALASGPERLASALHWEGVGAARTGDTERQRGAAERMARLVLQHADLDVVVFAALRTTLIAMFGGLASEARALLARLEDLGPLDARGGLVSASHAAARAIRAHYEHDAEAYAEGMALAAARYAAAGDARRAEQQRSNAGYALVLLGAHAEAERALSASVVEGARLGVLGINAASQQNLGLALSSLGRHPEAERVERASVEHYARGGDRQMESTSRTYLSRILLASGRIADSVAEAERAARLLADTHPWTHLARTALADALLARAQAGDVEAALSYARAARTALRAAPASFEEPAPVVRVFVDALEANGLRDEAARERDEARTWVTERARRIRSEHYRRAFLHDQPDNARILGHRASS